MTKISNDEWNEKNKMVKTKQEKYVRVEILDKRMSHGKSYIDTRCLNCGTRNIIYLWSYAGSGKRCKGCKKKIGLYSYLPFEEIKYNRRERLE